MKLDPTKLKIGDVILVNSGTLATRLTQEKLGYGDSSVWTHIAGSIGGTDIIEGQIPRSRVLSLQVYVDKGFPIKVLRYSWVNDADRIKTALWWATMNNLPYDYWELAWFPLAGWISRGLLKVRNFFDNKNQLICSELINDGFLKTGYNFFNRPSSDILPADFDKVEGLREVKDIWLTS